jgi:DNA-binding response OmpR family regulator
MDTNRPMIWIIDRQHWPRALLRAELLERGYEAVGFAGVDDAISAFRRRLYGRPQVIVLDLKDLVEGEERLRALAELGTPIVFLAGMVEERVAVLQGSRGNVLLRRPFTIGGVVEEVERHMARVKSSPREDAGHERVSE